jgi:hypothetical protein
VSSILILSFKLRSGFATIAFAYHDLIVSDTHYPEEPKYHDVIHHIHKAIGSLGLNLNEELRLKFLFLQCPSPMMLQVN